MKVKVCTGNSCKGRFSEYILERLENDIKFHDLKNLKVEESPCTGNCKYGPTVIIDGKIETKMTPAKVSEIVVGKMTGKPVKKKKRYKKQEKKETKKENKKS